MDPQQQPYQPANPYSSPPVPGQQPMAPQPYAPQPYSPSEQAAPVPTNIPPMPASQVLSVAAQVAQQISGANNLLVTVSNNPSVDQLSAAIGMALILNKLGKHATAVFSGTVPPAIEFLQPEKTLEKNTDSLRDFIIALDKAKADKLRYKIEDKYVKIFITPYRTSIDQKDLQFSQGELNVDVVLALGVKTQNELDQAIMAHGQILHDATIISINHQVGASLGSINWNETRTSSLCELIAKLAEILQNGQSKKLLDKQVATALLTGAISETDRFSNSKTTPETMTMAAKLMDAGANQPLISSKLEKLKPTVAAIADKPKAPTKTTVAQPAGGTDSAAPAPPPDSTIDSDGSLHIAHDNGSGESDDEDSDIESIHIDEHGELQRVGGTAAPAKTPIPTPVMTPVPTPVAAVEPPPAPIAAPMPEPADSLSMDGIADETLTDIEKAVNSPHLKEVPPPAPAPPAVTPNPNPLLASDPSLSTMNSVQPPVASDTPGSVNVNSSNPNDGPLFTPAGQISPTPSGGSSLPPPVPPPMSTPPDNNMSEPGSGGVPL